MAYTCYIYKYFPQNEFNFIHISYEGYNKQAACFWLQMFKYK